MSLAFNVNGLGPLGQIGLELADVPTILTLAYGGYKWLKPKLQAHNLDLVVQNSGAVISAPSSFRIKQYTEVRNTGKGLSGFARLANGKYQSISMPKATTACDGDSGLQCLRALTTALLCFYDADDTLKIFLKVLPGRLIRSELDTDEEDSEIQGPIIASLRKYVHAVHAEEEVDPVRKELLALALTSSESLLRSQTCEFDIIGYDEDMGRVIGFLTWVLTPQSERQPSYPTVSLSVWALSAVLQKLGLDVRASYPEIGTVDQYKKYIGGSRAGGGYDFPIYLVTAPTTEVDPNCVFLPSGPTSYGTGWRKRGRTEQYINTTIRNVPFVIGSLEQAYGRLNTNHNDGTFLKVYETLFLSIFHATGRYLNGESSRIERDTLLALAATMKMSVKDEINRLRQYLPQQLNVWLKEVLVDSDLSNGKFEYYQMNGNKWLTVYSFTPSDQAIQGESAPILFIAKYIEILIFRALAYGILAHSFGKLSPTGLNLEVRLAITNPAEEAISFLRLERHHQIITEYLEAAKEYPAVSEPHWQDLAVTSWIPGYSGEAELFLLYAHLITGYAAPNRTTPKQNRANRENPIVGLYFGGKTVLKRHFFDMHPEAGSFYSTLLIGDGLPLGLPLSENGTIGIGFEERNTEDQGVNYMLEDFKAATTTIKLIESNVVGLRVDVEVDWEDDDSKVHLVTRHRGKRFKDSRALSSQIAAGPKFGLLWMERMRMASACSCAAPVLESSPSFKDCCHITVSDILKTHLATEGVRDEYIESITTSEPIQGFRRKVYVANTKGCIAAQFHALELFLDFTLNALYGELTMNWNEFGGGDLALRKPGDFESAIFAKIHFVNCVRCWERDVLKKEEEWYKGWIASLKEPRKDAAAAVSQKPAAIANGSFTVQGSDKEPVINLVSFIIAV